MNDNPLVGFIVIVLAMLVGYVINVIHRRKKKTQVQSNPLEPRPLAVMHRMMTRGLLL